MVGNEVVTEFVEPLLQVVYLARHFVKRIFYMDNLMQDGITGILRIEPRTDIFGHLDAFLFGEKFKPAQFRFRKSHGHDFSSIYTHVLQDTLIVIREPGSKGWETPHALSLNLLQPHAKSM